MAKVYVSQYQMELIKDALWKRYKETDHNGYQVLYNEFYDLQEGQYESFEMVRVYGDKEDI